MHRRRFIAASAASLGALAARRSRASSDARGADVIVLGAGLSGLAAALLLEEQGLDVVVLEATDRIGGRLYTLDDVRGHPEAGGNGIGWSYARLIDFAKRVGVSLQPERLRTEPRANTMLHIRDSLVQMEDWPLSALNPMPEGLRELTPWQLLFNHVPKTLPSLELADWQSPEYGRLDVAVADYLAGLGFNAETIRLADRFASYGTNLYQTSLLQYCHVYAFARKSIAIGAGRGAMSIAGGNQRLPEAMARALSREVMRGQAATAIRLHADGVAVRTRDGSEHRARFLVSSLPFSALRWLAIDPPLAGPQARAVQTLPYHAAFQIHFEVESPFWERDGLPPSLWSDGPLERFNALYYGEEGALTSFMQYANGDSAGLLDRMPPQAAASFVLDELARIRPATRGALRPVRVWSWQQTPYAGGAYAAWAPGMIPGFATVMRASHGRLHFCGEHTAVLSRGMEGALESGERAALEVLERSL